MAWGEDIFRSFIEGIVLYTICLAITVLTRASSNHRLFSVILLIIVCPIGYLSGIFLLPVLLLGVEAMGDLVNTIPIKFPFSLQRG